MFLRKTLMSTLEAITTKQVLGLIPQNKNNSEALDAFVLQYLKDNPAVLDKHLSKTSLYHLFFRGEDPYEDPYDVKYDEIEFVKTFATEEAAIKYIEEHGAEIIHKEEVEERDRPIVLTIIKMDNESYYEPGSSPVHLYGIAQNMHKTFAFTKPGIDMCIREFESMLSHGYGEKRMHWVYFNMVPSDYTSPY